MIGKMAVATALCGFNDLGHSVTPTFLSKQILFTMIYTLSKMKKNWSWEVKKNVKIFVQGTSNPATLRMQGAWNYGR